VRAWFEAIRKHEHGPFDQDFLKEVANWLDHTLASTVAINHKVYRLSIPRNHRERSCVCALCRTVEMRPHSGLRLIYPTHFKSIN